MFAARAIAIGLVASILATGAISAEIDQTGSIQRSSVQEMPGAQGRSVTSRSIETVALPELSVTTEARRPREIHIKEFG